jgi:hypothetical protein
MAAMSALTLAILFLGASLVVCPLSLSGHFPSFGLTLPAPALLQILPTMAAMLGVLAGVLGMTAPSGPAEAAPEATNGAPPEREPEPPNAEPPNEGAPGLHAVVADLRALLVQERQELGHLRELLTNGTKETMLLAERLAGNVLDAELRLTASVVQAERALRHPSSAATRAAETSVKVERMLSRTESVLRNLPKATAQAVTLGADPASAHVPTGWQQELAALRATGQEISRSAQEAVATLSHAAQSTIGRLTEAVVTSVGASYAARAEPGPGETAFVEQTLGNLAAVTATLQNAADALGDRTASLCAAGQHVETVAARFAEQLLVPPLQPTVVGLDPDIVTRLEVAVTDLQQETSLLGANVARVAALEPMIDQHLSAAALVTAAAGRAEQSAESVANASQVIVETTDEVVLQIARLAGISGHAETQAAVLPAIAAQMAEATGRLQAVALQPPAHSAFPALAELLTRLEVTLAQQGGSAEALLSGLNEVQAGLAALSQRLARPDKTTDKGNSSALHQIDIVARESALLLRQTEALAEAVVSGQLPTLPPLLAKCTPALLAELESTIGRLRSVATALALASDGPPAKQTATLYASGNSVRP